MGHLYCSLSKSRLLALLSLSLSRVLRRARGDKEIYLADFRAAREESCEVRAGI